LIESKQEDGDGKKDNENGEETSTEDGKIPSFTVLLHGSLKVEGMVALNCGFQPMVIILRCSRLWVSANGYHS
jgi:hypothetical protein